MITPKYDEVKKLAERLGFDIHRVPGKYFIVCNWYRGNDCVAMFDDTPYGDDEAIKWMNEQKGGQNE